MILSKSPRTQQNLSEWAMDTLRHWLNSTQGRSLKATLNPPSRNATPWKLQRQPRPEALSNVPVKHFHYFLAIAQGRFGTWQMKVVRQEYVLARRAFETCRISFERIFLLKYHLAVVERRATRPIPSLQMDNHEFWRLPTLCDCCTCCTLGFSYSTCFIIGFRFG